MQLMRLLGKHVQCDMALYRAPCISINFNGAIPELYDNIFNLTVFLLL